MQNTVIVIGSGAGGAALAHRLSADPGTSVLVLEAGPDARPDVVAAPAQWPATLGGPYDYGYRTTPQGGLDGRVLDYHRGRLLGGTTCLNAMIHALPRAEDTESWGPGWTAADLEGARHGLESHRGGGLRRGTDGPVPNGPASPPNELCAAFIEACVEAGYERTDDLNDSEDNGAGWFDLSITGSGTRADAGSTLLRPFLDRPNLTVRCGAAVEELVLDGGRVRALLLRDSAGGAEELVVGDAEVVLCGGAIDSPLLLMRSGIGPAGPLRAAGIPVVIDLPGVGANLHDHPLLPVVWAVDRPLSPPAAQFFEAQLVLRDEPRAGGQHLAVAFGHLPYLPPGAPAPEHGASALIGLYGPHSRGSLTVDPEDPSGPPLIDPGFLSDARDVAALRAGLAITRELARRPAVTPFGLTEIVPGDALEDADEETFVRQATGSFFHPVGTCALGDGPESVVDRELLVRGTQNLRVADASVIPRIPAVATSATAQMIGWRLAERLLAPG